MHIENFNKCEVCYKTFQKIIDLKNHQTKYPGLIVIVTINSS